MSDNQKCNQSVFISLLLLVCLVVLLSSACDLKIQFPTLFTPTKKQLKRLIEADLPRTEALIVAFVGDDLSISFSHAVDADLITCAFM